MTTNSKHRKYDYELAAESARAAHDAGQSMGAAVAEATGADLRVANAMLTKLRKAGFDIPAGVRGPTVGTAYARTAATATPYFEGAELGACAGVDPELFFPERGASTAEAKQVCSGCVVREACLEYALVNVEKWGIWGGLSERERRQIRVRRNREAREAIAS